MRNILTIDLEDWYQDVEPLYWDRYKSRLIKNTEKLLIILNETRTYATFFILGYNAEKYPYLIKKIQNEGHEIGVHGYYHTNLFNQTPKRFKEELMKTLRILKRICKINIESYRAPQFSINMKTSWVFNILKKNRIKYDSSIFPVNTPLYDFVDAPRFPYYVSSYDIRIEDKKEDFMEFPISTFKVLKKKFL